MQPRVREKKHRLPRRAYVGEQLVAVTACIEHRNRPFEVPELTGAFISELRTALEFHDCLAPIYCFMPDHLHLIVKGTKETSDTRAAVEKFKQKTGWWFKQNLPTVCWQEDFYDHIIRNSEDHRAQFQYIAANPMRAGLSKHQFDYPFTGSIGYDLEELLLFGL
jgi:putative transposase